jgi:hypothetical protein
MGTRSNTVIIDTGYGKPVKLVNMYRQFDGYPSGHGKELSDFLSKITMVNGIFEQGDKKMANGAGCLAAQMIAHFKTEPGGIYIDIPTGKCDNDYTYIVRADTYRPSKGISVEVREYGKKKLFEGSAEKFAEWLGEFKE